MEYGEDWLLQGLSRCGNDFEVPFQEEKKMS